MSLKQLNPENILQESTNVLLIPRESYPNLGKLDSRALSDILEKGSAIILPFYIYQQMYEKKYFKMITPDYFSEKQLTQLRMAPIQYDFQTIGKQLNIKTLQLIAQYVKDKNIQSKEIEQILKRVQQERINNYSKLNKPSKEEKAEQRRRDRLNKQFGRALACDIE